MHVITMKPCINCVQLCIIIIILNLYILLIMLKCTLIGYLYIYTLPNSQQLYSQQWYCYIACDKLRGLVAAIYNSLLSKLTCYTVTSIIVGRFSENCCMRLYTLVVQLFVIGYLTTSQPAS